MKLCSRCKERPRLTYATHCGVCEAARQRRYQRRGLMVRRGGRYPNEADKVLLDRWDEKTAMLLNENECLRTRLDVLALIGKGAVSADGWKQL